MARYPEESIMTMGRKQAFLKRLAENKDDFVISTFIGNRFVTNAGVQKIQDLMRFRHRAGFGIFIREEVCSLDLSTIILWETIT